MVMKQVRVVHVVDQDVFDASIRDGGGESAEKMYELLADTPCTFEGRTMPLGEVPREGAVVDIPFVPYQQSKAATDAMRLRRQLHYVAWDHLDEAERAAHRAAIARVPDLVAARNATATALARDPRAALAAVRVVVIYADEVPDPDPPDPSGEHARRTGS